MADTCDICKFVWPDNTCRAHPPVAVIGVASMVQPSWMWPTVTADDWCGEFQPVPPPTAPPANTVQPAVTGTGSVGSTLTCSTGTWDNKPTSYAFQWLRQGVDIPDETNATYTTVADDLSHMIKCHVTATNSLGSTQVMSTGVAVLS